MTKDMLLRTRPCPNCHGEHGHGAWRVSNSSVIKPLRCRACGGFFHQTGLSIWLATGLLFPAGTMSVLVARLLEASTVPWLAQWAHALSFVAALASYLVVAAVLVNRTRPLAPGPRHG